MSWQAIKISLNWKKVKKPSPSNQCVNILCMNAVNLLKRTDLLLRYVPKDILRLRFLYNCSDRAERTICDKIGNTLPSNVFQ